jgi:DNA-binding NtrC family response regulator
MVKAGAYDFFTGSEDHAHIEDVLAAALEDRRSRQLQRLSASVGNSQWKQGLIGESRPMQNVERIIRLAGPRRCTVLITGETGTGKEMAARALHLASPRAHLPMVAVNCAAIPDTLLEAELFGHAKGAFTGAVQARVGRFEQANGSTIFLDEIGDMPLDLQAKLLRVLQEREFQRVGSSETVKVDVRVIAASNLNLADRVKEGKFREDLYYRLNVVPIRMPALRERPGDIPALARHFIEKLCRREGLPAKNIHRDTLDRLCAYEWPGNVRELENVIELALVLSGERETLLPCDFDLTGSTRNEAAADQAAAGPVFLPEHGMDLERALVEFERTLVSQALKRTGGNKTAAADILRIPRTTLISKIRALENAVA